MNLVLFKPGEESGVLGAGDPRLRHIRKVLRRSDGESFDAAVVDASLGRASVHSEPGGGARVVYEARSPAPAPATGALLCGICRPQAVRRVVRDVATLGCGCLVFFPTDRGEPSYAEAGLWSSGELEDLILEAAAQAFNPRLVPWFRAGSLDEAIDRASGHAGFAPGRFALDNYEAKAPLAAQVDPQCGYLLAVGSERGWSASERIRLKDAGFELRHLGSRVLRTETACLVGTALLASSRWSREAG